MTWSWRVGKIAGIDLYVHFTFLILLAWVGIAHLLARGSVAAAAYGVLFILLLFGIVVLHELGHALAARRYGIATRDITLLPIGGVARLERMPDDPRQELVVALAGPAVNVALALVLFAVIALSPRDPVLDDRLVATSDATLLDRLLWVNVVLAVFNLLPAFPMDGGRVLRALLALRTDYVRATRIAARVRAALANVPVADAMLTGVTTLAPGDPLHRAADLIRAGARQDFAVVDGGALVGVLTREDLVSGLGRLGPDGPVEGAMCRAFVTLEPQEMLDTALRRLQSDGCRAMPVVDEGRVVGMVTADHLTDWLVLRDAGAGPREPLSTIAAPIPRREVV